MMLYNKRNGKTISQKIVVIWGNFFIFILE